MKKILIKVSIIALILSTLVLAIFFGFKYLKYSGKLSEWENKKILKQISAKIVLPDEVPTFATVADKAKLEDQPFFKNSENGDKVLIFTNSGRVVLYRPSIKKIIDISTVTVATGSNSLVPMTTPTPIKKVKVALLNGSSVNGLANKVEKDVFSQIDDIQIISKDSAKNKYDTNIVVATNTKYSELAKALAELLKGTVAPLPNGEKTSEADILIILGKSN
jgi:hypothetical protein